MERGAGGGEAKTPPQLRGGRKACGAVSIAAEGRRAESGEVDREADGAGRRRAGLEGQIELHTTGEGAAKAEGSGANEENKRDTGEDALEGREAGNGINRSMSARGGRRRGGRRASNRIAKSHRKIS